MDYEPFDALSPPAKARPKEKDPVCEESYVSLELSLSLDYTSTAIATDKGKEEIFEAGKNNYGSIDQYLRKEDKMNNIIVEKKTEGTYLELCDISLELSQDKFWESKEKCRATDEGNEESFEVGEHSSQYQREEHNLKPKVRGLSLQLSLGFHDTCTSKKRERMEHRISTRKVSSCRNKRTKVERVEKSEAVLTELRLDHDPWCIKKQLFGSDLGNMSRLLLASEVVQSHVFPFWNADQRSKIKEGLPVSVWDCDTNTKHEMVFKQWSNGFNVLIKNWVKDFVKRRELKLGDEIGLYWDNCSSRFNFTVLNRAARH